MAKIIALPYDRNGEGMEGELRFTLDTDAEGIESYVIPGRPARAAKAARGKRAAVKARKASADREVFYLPIKTDLGEIRATLSRNIYAGDDHESAGRLLMNLTIGEIIEAEDVEDDDDEQDNGNAVGSSNGDSAIEKAIFDGLVKGKKLEPMAQFLTESKGYTLRKARIVAEGLGCK